MGGMKKFWKVYFGNWKRLIFMGILLMPLTGLMTLIGSLMGISPFAVIGFVIAYILFDPVSYYLIEYRKR